VTNEGEPRLYILLLLLPRCSIVYGVSDNVLFVEHSLKKVMDTVSVSCQVRHSNNSNSNSVCFCRAMLCIGRPMPSCGHLRCLCLSVSFVDCVKTNKHIFKIFSPSRS